MDPSFDLDSSLKSDNDFLVEKFCEDWVLQLDRDDKVSLGVFLCFQLSKHVGLKQQSLLGNDWEIRQIS